MPGFTECVIWMFFTLSLKVNKTLKKEKKKKNSLIISQQPPTPGELLIWELIDGWVK